MGKKRKADVLGADLERTLYSTFVAAANSVSTLYTQAIQQHRNGAAQAARGALERVMRALMRDYGAAGAIPVAAVLQYLKQEYDALEEEPAASPAAQPASGQHPFGGCGGHAGDKGTPRAQQHMMVFSPGRRGLVAGMPLPPASRGDASECDDEGMDVGPAAGSWQLHYAAPQAVFTQIQPAATQPPSVPPGPTGP
jgi:hypothetical protein